MDRISPRSLAVSLGLGLLYAVHLYGFLGAAIYLPVNMAILTYFLHPLMIGVAAMFAGRQRVSPLRLGALVAAVIGLTLAMGFSLEQLAMDPGCAPQAQIRSGQPVPFESGHSPRVKRTCFAQAR